MRSEARERVRVLVVLAQLTRATTMRSEESGPDQMSYCWSVYRLVKFAGIPKVSWFRAMTCLFFSMASDAGGMDVRVSFRAQPMTRGDLRIDQREKWVCSSGMVKMLLPTSSMSMSSH